MMETRVLGRTGIQVGVVGLGVEHLHISQENMDAVFDLAVSAGVNYIDLVYHDPLDECASHWDAITPSLQRYRSSLVLALHWGGVEHEPHDRCRQCFDSALARVGNGYVDVALLGIVDTEALWQGWAQDAIEQLQQYQRDGRVGFIGLANHTVEVARMAVASNLIDVFMFPINLYQHPQDPQRAALLEECVTRNIGVVAMKPYYGGRLLGSEGRYTGISPVQCLHYVLSQPVSTAVPGVNTATHLQQALHYVHASADEKRHDAVGDALAHELQGQCVYCQHCLPCPQEIRIPLLIQSLDYVEFYSGTAWSKNLNRELFQHSPAPASACIECGVCVERCPFGVDIIGKMHRATAVFEA